MLWRDLDDADGALAACDEAIAAEPDSPLGYVEKADILWQALSHPEQTIAVATEGLEAAGENYGLHILRGYALSELGRHEEALEDMNAAVKLTPLGGISYYHRATVLYELGRYEEAWRDVHTAESGLSQIGWTPSQGFIDKLSEAMPEPERDADDGAGG
ncbi:MAG: tetratricopeptide repeat protein [Armatimonadota bacterium]|nr:tetratricopeptide repeat protein [Armatimonadota bacterium]